MQDELVTRLTDRIRRYRTADDQAILFGPEADEEVRALYAALFLDDGDPRRINRRAAHTLIRFHMAREETEPGINDYAELGAAVSLSNLVAASDPDGALPGFAEAKQALAERAYRLAREGRDELQRHLNGDRNALNDAVRSLRRASNLAATGGIDVGHVAGLLSNALRQRYMRDGTRIDLNEAIEYRRQSITLAFPNHPDLPLRLQILSTMLLQRYDLAHDPVDLDDAIDNARHAVTLTGEEHPNLVTRWENLGAALYRRFRRDDTLDDLNESISLALAAINDSRQGSGIEPAAGALTERLCARCDRTGTTADLDLAVNIQRQLLERAGDAPPADFFNNLGTALFRRYERIGRLADIDEAVVFEKQALALRKPDDKGRRMALTNLTASLRMRFDRTRAMSDLDEAIRIGTEAVSTSDERSSTIAFANMATLHLYRYRLYFERADVERARQFAERAVASAPEGHPDRAVATGNLIEVLGDQLDELGRPSELDEMIRWGRRTVDSVPVYDPMRDYHLANLSRWLLVRFDRDGDPKDLSDATVAAQEALANLPPGRFYRMVALDNAASAHVRRFDLDGANADLGDLDRAVDLARQALAEVRDTDLEPRQRMQLGQFLEERAFRRNDSRHDLSEALTHFAFTANAAAAAVGLRMEAGRSLGRVGAKLGDLDSCVAGYGRAMELLPTAVWHGLSWPARRQLLKEQPGVASNAAASLILTGKAHRAVEVLEQGRLVIWKQTLHLRSDLSALATVAPELADRLGRIRDQLDQEALPVGTEPEPTGGDRLLVRSAREERNRQRMALAVEWDNLVSQVRRLDGFANFLGPVPFNELRQAAAAGPVVILNVSELGCHALILHRPKSDVDVVHFGSVTPNEIGEQALAFANALLHLKDRNRSFLDRERDRHVMLDVLAWLWDRIVEPVLKRLSPPSRPGPSPRVWWCPTGFLTLLPLHAAGHHPRHRTAEMTDRTVADRFISSYTPTLSALLRARDVRTSPAPLRQLAVGVPNTPGRSPLPGVANELSMLTRYFPVPASAVHLIGPQATVQQVCAALREVNWVHMACHAEQDPEKPDEGAFILADGPLLLTELATMSLPAARFAYLSACESAYGGIQLLDDAVHLAAAMHLLGFQQVVACIWNVSDVLALEVAAEVYGRLCATPEPDAAEAARALHFAVAELYRARPGDPWRWAPFIHFGS